MVKKSGGRFDRLGVLKKTMKRMLITCDKPITKTENFIL